MHPMFVDGIASYSRGGSLVKLSHTMNTLFFNSKSIKIGSNYAHLDRGTLRTNV